MSIGLVREDGVSLYMVNNECDLTRPLSDSWHVENTIPKLISKGDKIACRNDIAMQVRGFAGVEPEFWAYFADYDWVALCQLFGRMIDLPSGWPMFCRDFKQLCAEHEWQPREQVAGQHNALEDAKWLKREFGRFQARNREGEDR